MVIGAGPAAKLAFTTPPANGTAGVGFAVGVTVQDSAGNTVANTATIGLAISSGTGPGGSQITCDTNPVNAVAGVAGFSGCKINKASTGSPAYALVAGDTTDTLFKVSGTFTIAVGPASQLGFTVQPGGGIAGTAFGTQPQVTVQDAGGNTVSNSDSISLAITAATNPQSASSLTCTSNPLTASSGVATFAGCKISKPGQSYTLTATDSTHSLTGVSNTLTVSAGPASQLHFTSAPSSGFGGTTFGTQPVVAIQDAGGNPVSGIVSLTLSGGTPGAKLRATLIRLPRRTVPRRSPAAISTWPAAATRSPRRNCRTALPRRLVPSTSASARPRSLLSRPSQCTAARATPSARSPW